MTIEEAFKLLSFIKAEIYDQVFYDYDSYAFDESDYKAFEMAIRSLEAWKKIADSINLLQKRGADDAVYVKINDVFDIIDKHLKEVEE